MANREDIELVQRVIAKEPAAFDQFFEIYFGRIYRFCNSKIRDPASCEDIVQETLIKAIRSLPGYRGEASLFTWLCQICRSEMSNWYQKTGRKQEMMVSLDDNPSIRSILETLDGDDADAQANRFITERLVQMTLDYLPDRYGRALEWKYLEGLSVEEIADRLGTGVIATQSLLARARQAFRQGFSDVQREVEVPA